MARNRFWSSLLVVASLVALVLAAPAATSGAGAAGRRVPTRTLVGFATGDSFMVQLAWAYDPILFQLTSFRGKYKVVRIDLVNKGQKTFLLSAADDRLVALISGRAVPMILDLGAGDREAWDSLGDEMRRNLAYPAKIDPGEQATVFAYLKDLQPNAAVTELHYSVASFPASPITLRTAPAMAR
jgi:hypothetical protein